MIDTQTMPASTHYRDKTGTSFENQFGRDPAAREKAPSPPHVRLDSRKQSWAGSSSATGHEGVSWTLRRHSMIANDQELKVTLDRIAQLQAQVAYLRNTGAVPINYRAKELGVSDRPSEHRLNERNP